MKNTSEAKAVYQKENQKRHLISGYGAHYIHRTHIDCVIFANFVFHFIKPFHN